MERTRVKSSRRFRRALSNRRVNARVVDSPVISGFLQSQGAFDGSEIRFPLPNDWELFIDVDDPGLELVNSLIFAESADIPFRIAVAVSDLSPTGVVLDVTGPPNRGFAIEASANLKDWSLLGQSTETVPGRYQYIDDDAGRYIERFYRAFALDETR